PLGLREAEESFSEARALRAKKQPASVSDAQFDAYLKSLVAAGLPADLVQKPDVRGYLRWRLTVSVEDRMDDFSDATMARTQRDPVLARALELVKTANTQADLFTASDRVNATTATARLTGQKGAER